MTDVTGLTGVAAQEVMKVVAGYWVVDGWEVRRRGSDWWEGTLSFAGSCRELRMTGSTLREVRERIAEGSGQ